MKYAVLGLLTMSLFFTGCASVNSLSLTPIPADRKNAVRVEKSKVIILGFNFDNDFVDTLVVDLKRQCPNGKVTGLLTKDENINYFLYIVWKKQITVSGYCVGGTTASRKVKRTRGTASEEAPEVEEAEPASAEEH